MARRHPRPAKSYRRKESIREPYDVVLIVCEGSKTEPEYLKGLQRTSRLSNANITILPGDGTDPVSIVKHALKLYRQADGAYDQVFCVFDRDGHVNYQQALDQVGKSPLGRKGKLVAITSVPCFEFWVLLHFEYTAAPFTAAGGKSACEKVIEKVRAHFPEYQKAMVGVYESLLPRADTAITRAQTLAQHNLETGTSNPATKVHELVTYLRGLKK
jgi:RloB-like protein